MKDLEKIKSEDLGCQVADANPGNFAIEQEVAAMVGATVPAPSEPSADDARELGAQLLVFLRRALLPIRSALRTALAAIYAHLDSRCTDYTPAAYAGYLPLPSYDPMGTPPTPRTLPNLLTALTAFAPRKISGVDIDGISLTNLLCNAYLDVNEITDDNSDYDAYPQNLKTMVDFFPNLQKITIGAKTISFYSGTTIINHLDITEVNLPNLEYFGNHTSRWNSYFVCTLLQGTSVIKVTMPKLESIHFAQFNGYSDRSAMFRNCYYLEEIDAPNLTTSLSSNPSVTSCALAAGCAALRVVRTNIEIAGSDTGGYYGGLLVNCPELRVLVVGQIKTQATSMNILKDANGDSNMPNLIHLEIGSGVEVSLNFSRWNPTMALRIDTTASDYVDLREDTTTYQNNQQQFLANFRAYILDKLKPYVGETGKPTLTLSQAVYDLVSAQDWYTQEKARINWEITA